ncbi:MAG: TIGR04283 family arsenosugar biosynthesis glycosyltransferase [Planctomycetota bacterium]
MTDRRVTVIIPTFNEAENVSAAIESAKSVQANQVIVVDGGSQDDTRTIARSHDVELVESDPGRGTQLANAMEASQGEVVLFLHADNRLAPGVIDQLKEAGWPPWGGFRQQIDDRRLRFRLLEFGNSARVRWLGRVFGDQAMFVSRSLLESVGGVPSMPLMEDVELSMRLRTHSKPVLLSGPVYVDARRWHRRGVIRQTMLNWRLQWLYARRAKADELAERYR